MACALCVTWQVVTSLPGATRTAEPFLVFPLASTARTLNTAAARLWRFCNGSADPSVGSRPSSTAQMPATRDINCRSPRDCSYGKQGTAQSMLAAVVPATFGPLYQKLGLPARGGARGRDTEVVSTCACHCLAEIVMAGFSSRLAWKIGANPLARNRATPRAGPLQVLDSTAEPASMHLTKLAAPFAVPTTLVSLFDACLLAIASLHCVVSATLRFLCILP